MSHLCSGLREDPWWRRLDAVKVTGSNGKGSVATMTAAILRAAGLRVGLTVSPHVLHPGERIQVDGRAVPEDQLEVAAAALRRRFHAAPAPPLAFEAVTALALGVFQQLDVDAVVAEAGIGGRHDATRILPGSTSVLVSVDLEHRRILGETQEAIAADKADLAHPGTELLVGPIPEAVGLHLLAHGRHRRIDVTFLDQVARVRDTISAAEGLGKGSQSFELDVLEAPAQRWSKLQMPVLGAAQRTNAALAVIAARRWMLRHRPQLAAGFTSAVHRGLADLELPGRLGQLRRDPPVWLDVAHTPAAIEHLRATAAERLGRPILLVLGISSDKDPALLVPPLLEISRRVIVTSAAERGGETAPLVALAEDAGKPVEVYPEVAAAVERAVEIAGEHGFAVLVAGGLFLAREAADALS